ncbi:MAG: apolipoprotein N-acyltransferase [Candidatus Omnitrophica bacterium]|nr:apolipoprotein N-acyltransferase [Candidatus Omnitrophota bacterium]
MKVHDFSVRPPVLALISGVLLTLSFPDVSWGFLAWIALIPLLGALHYAKSVFESMKLGFITGFVFFAVSLHWLTQVTVFGWIFLILLETCSLVLFAVLVYQGRAISYSILKLLWISSAWTLAELVRSEIPIFGFGWNLLAYSQADYLWVIQAANTIGAYGLGFVIVFVNACGFEGGRKLANQKVQGSFVLQKNYVPFGFLILVLGLLAGHGFFYLHQNSNPRREVRISVIQGNIPQVIKWEPAAQDPIVELYSQLTRLAVLEGPEIIFWPEAAFPGYFNRDLRREKILEMIRGTSIPLVLGSPHLEDNLRAYNSAYLIGADGEMKNRYDKRYLVPFGEYIPLKPLFGWLSPIAESLGVSDFYEGDEATIFSVLNDDFKFSTLICFEDIFPSLSRSFTQAGAHLLGVLTNDAWFGKTAAPYQHLQASIFRAVENGVPIVRAANTGVSAFISPKGEVLVRIENQKGESIFISGHKTMNIPFEDNPRKTLYQQGGWIFPYVALIGFVIMFFAMGPQTRDLKKSKRK